MTEKPAAQARSFPWGAVVRRGLLLVAGGAVLYLLAPQLLDLVATAPRLADIRLRWFGAMLLLETGSFVAAWGLTRVAVPQVSWFVAATSQLSANAVSRVVPGGAVVGGALYYRMLSVSGMDPGQAAAALAANSVLSTLVLLALPAVAALGAAISAPVPNSLLPVAVIGGVLFVLMFAGGAVLVRFDRPLLLVGRALEGLVGWAARRFDRPWGVSAQGFVERRNEMVEALGSRWHQALGAASANWLLDYLALMAALYGVGARPRLSLVLLAYAAAAVLAMIPITPGGFGFVEVGLTAMLTVAGVPGRLALLATLAYRLFSFWLPIPAGAGAYALFRRRYGRPEDLGPEPPP